MNPPETQFTCIPNFIFDNYLGLLTPAEFKVLAYIARRTFGFQRETDKIPLSQFADGLPDKDTGTGLTVGAIRKALNGLLELKIIYRAAENDPRSNQGAEWGFEEQSKEQAAALQERITKQSSQEQKRTAKAREAMKAKRLLSHNTRPIVPQHAAAMSDNTHLSMSDNTPDRKKEERKILDTSNEVSRDAPILEIPKAAAEMRKPELKLVVNGTRSPIPPSSGVPPAPVKKRKERKPREPTVRDAVTNAIAFGAAGMKKGDGFNASQGAIVIRDQLGDKPTDEAIVGLADRITRMYIWHKTAHSNLDPPAKASSIIKYLNEFAEKDSAVVNGCNSSRKEADNDDGKRNKVYDENGNLISYSW